MEQQDTVSQLRTRLRDVMQAVGLAANQALDSVVTTSTEMKAHKLDTDKIEKVASDLDQAITDFTSKLTNKGKRETMVSAARDASCLLRQLRSSSGKFTEAASQLCSRIQILVEKSTDLVVLSDRQL